MDLSLQASVAERYKSSSQRSRLLTEHWVAAQAYCPNCGSTRVTAYPNNSRIADFFCADCDECYELKSTKRSFGAKFVDGSHSAMMERLAGGRNPNFLLLSYHPTLLAVLDFTVIPKHFFTPGVIEKRRPLPTTARRAGWIGCNVRLRSIPMAGRISLVHNGLVVSKAQVLATWRRTLFLRDQKDASARGWLLSVMQCIERLGQKTFSLEQVYQFEDKLRLIYPENRHIKPKIRQQLQVLRDKGYLEFAGRGMYRLRLSDTADSW